MPRRDPKVRLLHMRDYARKAVTMIEGQKRDTSSLSRGWSKAASVLAIYN